MIRKWLLALVLGSGLALGSLALAQKPVQQTAPPAHPNLAASQKLVQQAWDKLTAAQKANEFDRQGHAARAKDLLAQVNSELALATQAEAANK